MQGVIGSKREKEIIETFVYDLDGDVSRIYGVLEGNFTDGISIYIEPSEFSDPEKLKFKVEALYFSHELLSMQLKFENPAYVSTRLEKDVLVIDLNDFEDPDGKLIVDACVLKKKLPN